ncbi:hypothetical protein ACXR0O_25085 [Verrucomicrobiota bacterium sgz303538]
MITIRRFGTRFDAESAVVALEAEGIESRILEEPVFGAAGVSTQGIQLQVAETDVARALAQIPEASQNKTEKLSDNGFLRGGIVGVLLFVAASHINAAGELDVKFTGLGMFGVFVLSGICGMLWWPAIAKQSRRES